MSGEAAVSSSVAPAENPEPGCWESAGVEPLDGNTSQSL